MAIRTITLPSGRTATGEPGYEVLDPTEEQLQSVGYSSPDPQELAGIAQEPTSAVVSNATINEEVKPELDSKLKQYSQTGNYYGPDGVQRDASGNPIVAKDESQVFLDNLKAWNIAHGRQPTDATGIKQGAGGSIDATGAYDAEGNVIGATAKTETPTTLDPEIQALFDQQKQISDARTKRQLEVIESRFSALRARQAEIDRRYGEAIEKSLLSGKGGGSARYAQLSSTGIQKTQDQNALINIAELNSQEQELINAALSAQEDRDYQLMEKKINLFEQKRKEKERKMEELANKKEKEMAEANKKLYQVTRESAIIDLYNQGITDPKEMLDYLNYTQKGNLVGDITLDEINKTLKIINPPENLVGMTPDLKTYKYLQSIKDPSVEGLSYLEFLDAVNTAEANAKQKAGIGLSDYEQAFLRDKGRLPTVQELLDYKAKEAAARRAPTMQPSDGTPDSIFSTPDGTPVDITTVDGINYLKEKGYDNYGELFAYLDQNTKLTTTAINNLLQEAGIRKPTETSKTQKLTEKQMQDVAVALVKQGGFAADTQGAKDIINSGKIRVQGKDIYLTPEDQQRIIAIIDEQYSSGKRTILQSILPGGK